MNINPEIQKRIFDAAAQLHSEGGHAEFPTVDAVRRLARTNMNDTSIAMKLWRTMQTTATSPPPASIPDVVQRIQHDGLMALWNAAHEHANANLRTAQAGWESERAEAEAVLSQLAVSFDIQTAELETTQRALDGCRGDLAACQRRAEDGVVRLDAITADNRALDSQVGAANTLIAELHGHVAELRRDLGQANENASRLQKKCDDASQAAHEQALELKTSLATMAANLTSATELLANAQREREQATQALTDARDLMAELRGQVEALNNQNADLLKALLSKKG